MPVLPNSKELPSQPRELSTQSLPFDEPAAGPLPLSMLSCDRTAAPDCEHRGGDGNVCCTPPGLGPIVRQRPLESTADDEDRAHLVTRPLVIRCRERPPAAFCLRS